MAKLFNDPRIYLKESDRVRLADYRARIVRETDPREPCDNEDLVFEKAEDESLIPANALYKWKFDCNNEPIWFFTTAERCKQMVSKDPSYWTQEKLKEIAKIEKKLYMAWWEGCVYGYIIEKWDKKRREWMTTSSLWGMYGAEELLDNLATETDGVNIPVCIDEEDMKYEFDNTEKKPNEFKGENNMTLEELLDNGQIDADKALRNIFANYFSLSEGQECLEWLKNEYGIDDAEYDDNDCESL